MRPALICKTLGAFPFVGQPIAVFVINDFVVADSSIAGSFDAKCKAARSGAVHLQIIDFAVRKQTLASGLEFSVGNICLRDQPSAPRISLKRARASAKFFRETTVLIVSGTFSGMHVNWPRLRQFFHPSESVIREQDGLVHLRRNQAQAMTAWRRVGC
jgi:hypothetical protein